MDGRDCPTPSRRVMARRSGRMRRPDHMPQGRTPRAAEVAAAPSTMPAHASPNAPTAPLVTGSTLGHVVRMTLAGAVGLVAVFAVDAVNLFYIGLLGRTEITAALGYASNVAFLAISVAIGLSIAASAIVARAFGAGQPERAHELAGASLAITGGLMTLLALLCWPLLPWLLALLGARGEAATLGLTMLQILLPSWPLLGIGMCLAGLLRARGDARRAMYVTLGAAAVTVVLDPLLIFVLGLGLNGAALTTVVARATMVAAGLYSLLRVHRLRLRWHMTILQPALRPFFAIAVPAILTQVATPVGNAFVTAAMAQHGDDAVAGWTIVSRLIPVAFGLLFALSGAVGPVIGQNFGARRYDRVLSTLQDSLRVCLVYVLVVWALLAVFAEPIAGLFRASGDARTIVVFFCVWVAGSFLFNGMLFVANAVFNNLGHAVYSTLLNWGRATLGVIPFVWLGQHGWGVQGAIAGYGLGAVVFGIVAYALSLRVVRGLARQHAAAAPPTR